MSKIIGFHGNRSHLLRKLKKLGVEIKGLAPGLENTLLSTMIMPNFLAKSGQEKLNDFGLTK